MSSLFFACKANGPTKRSPSHLLPCLHSFFPASIDFSCPWLTGLGSSPGDTCLGLEVPVMAASGCAWISSWMYCPVSFRVSFTGSVENTAVFGLGCFQAKEGNGMNFKVRFAWRRCHEYWPFISVLIVVHSPQIYMEARTSWRLGAACFHPCFLEI